MRQLIFSLCPQPVPYCSPQSTIFKFSYLIMLEVKETEKSCHLLARPNQSISKAGAFYATTIIGLFLLVIAMSFALIGAWPVIIYAVLVVIGLSLAFQKALQSAGDFERLTITQNSVLLEVQQDGVHRRHEFNSHWLKVILEEMPDGDCRRLALRAHGKEFEFGRNLCSAEKYDASKKLKARLISL